MINKLICLIFGHKINIDKCPYSNASKQYCLRCKPQNTNSMSFK